VIIFLHSIHRLVFTIYNDCVFCMAVPKVLCIILMGVSLINRALAKTFSYSVTFPVRLQLSVVYCETVSEKLALQWAFLLFLFSFQLYFTSPPYSSFFKRASWCTLGTFNGTTAFFNNVYISCIHVQLMWDLWWRESLVGYFYRIFYFSLVAVTPSILRTHLHVVSTETVFYTIIYETDTCRLQFEH
jgi:hypothetical protein